MNIHRQKLHLETAIEHQETALKHLKYALKHVDEQLILQELEEEKNEDK